MRQINYYKQIIQTLDRLHKNHPSINMGKHISTATNEYKDLWDITDKAFILALKKYEGALNMDVTHNEDIEEIIKTGMNLNSFDLYEEEEE